jgi:hypothetical protein
MHQDLYGIYLIISLVCVWFCAFEQLSKRLKSEWLIQVLCAGLVIILWSYQNWYRHYGCREAVGCKEMCQIMEDWELSDNGKLRAIERLNYFEGNSKPWAADDFEEIENNNLW